MGDPNTTMGQGERAFPLTRWSIVLDAGDEPSETRRHSLERFAQLYWRPVYFYLRSKWGQSNEEAKDLAQEFFASIAERDRLMSLSPERGKFRSYVMGALDNIVRMKYRREDAQKRGGDFHRVPMEVLNLKEPATPDSPEKDFSREWAAAILADALRELEEEYRKVGEENQFKMFVSRQVDPPVEGPPSYEELAQRFGMSESTVRNALHRAKLRLQRIVVERIRETVTGDQELDEEMRELFGSLEQ